jgi:hypothetical protein
MPTLKQLSKILSKDEAVNRVQDQLVSALNPILKAVKGDLSGPLESPKVVALQGYAVAPTAPVYGSQLIYDDTANPPAWQVVKPAYGDFLSRVTQAIPTFASGTPLAAACEITQISKNVSTSSATSYNRFTVTQDGIYEASFSAQYHNTSGGSRDIWSWVRVNGVDVDDTTSVLELGNNNRSNFPFFAIKIELKANDYIQFMFAASGTGTELQATAAVVGPPARPLDPSIIVDIKRLSL